MARVSNVPTTTTRLNRSSSTAETTTPTSTTSPASQTSPATASNYQAGGQVDAQTAANLSSAQPGSTLPANATPKKGLENSAEVQASQAASEAKPVDQAAMDAKYDFLKDLVTERSGGDAGAWKTGEGEVNLIGVRSETDGRLNDGAADKYNDTIYACRIKDGKKEVYAFDATVDSGAWDKDRAIETGMAVVDKVGKYKGITNMADGHYSNAFEKGTVTGGVTGLNQSGWVRTHLDANGDGAISDKEKGGDKGEGLKTGAAARLQFHPGFGENVGEASAGCQVIRGEQYGTFEKLLNEAPDSQKRFSYTLVDGKDLQGVSAEEQHARALAQTDSKGHNQYEQLSKVRGGAYRVAHAEHKLYERDQLNRGAALGIGVDGKNSSKGGAWGRGLLSKERIGRGYQERENAVKAYDKDYDGDGGIGIIRTPFWDPRYLNKWYI